MPTPTAIPTNALRPINKRGLWIAGGFALFLVAFGTLSIIAAICADGSAGPRMALWLLAATTLALPLFAAFVILRRKIRTGRFLPSDEERLTNRIKLSAREATPRYQKYMKFFWHTLTVFWIVIVAIAFVGFLRHPEKSHHVIFLAILAILNGFTSISMAGKQRPATSSTPDATPTS